MNAAATRRRVVVTAPGTIEIQTEAVPDLEPGEALVKLRVSGVCGSDRAGAAGEHAFFRPPYYPGHEVVGQVVEIGTSVDEVAVGDLVTAEPTLVCGHCKACTTGRENLCDNLEFFGCGYREGGMADMFTIPAGRLHIVPPNFTDHQAALIEPLATPVHAVRLAGNLAGKTIAILGAGTIGLLVLVVARQKGARRIVVTDTLARKRDLALRLGADAVVDAVRNDLAEAVRAELGESADVVFDCVSNQATVQAGIEMVLKGGTVVLVGGARKSITIDLPVVQEYQVRLQGAITYRAEDFQDAIGLIASGAVDPTDFITATFPLSRAAEAFAAMRSGAEVKILVTGEDDGNGVMLQKQGSQR